jgi:hypothetical protein
MNLATRAPALALLLAAGVVVAGCGRNGAVAGNGPDGSDGEPSTDDYDHPTGADDVVISIDVYGSGVAPPTRILESDLPSLLVTGDGRVVFQALLPPDAPDPLVRRFAQRDIGEDGLQQLLTLADEHGLLAEVEYDDSQAAEVVDAVVVTAGGHTYEHVSQQHLDDFVEAVESRVGRGGGTGDLESHVTDSYLMLATAIDATGTDAPPAGTENQVFDWPADAPARLADAAECAEVPAAGAAGDLLTGATASTRFRDGGQTYEVEAIPVLPGSTACR